MGPLPPIPGPLLPISKDNHIKPSLHLKSMAISNTSTLELMCVLAWSL